MSMFLQDLLHSVRLLRSRPGFTAVAVVSLALGIAANTTIFSILSATLLKPVDLPGANRAVQLSTYSHQNPQFDATVSVPEFELWKERAQSFEFMGAMFAATQARTLGADGDGWPAEQLPAFAGEREVLDAWGVQPLLGRLFTPEEDRVGQPAAVTLLSYRFWQRRFGGDPDVLGQTLVLDGSPATIIGVMPEGLEQTILRPGVELWIPWGPAPSMIISQSGFTHIHARLRPGVSVQQAQAEMDAIAAQLETELPDTHAGRGIRVQTLEDSFYGNVREIVLLLQGAVLLVLLIACANVAMLLLASAASRQTEIALRGALGAGRRRIVRQVLTECLVLASFGGLLGLLLAWGAMRLFVGLAPPFLLPGLERVALDAQVLAFAAAVVALTAVAFGLAPALASSRPDLATLLNETPRGSTAGGARARFRLALVTGQTALALILLISAGLLIHSFARLQDNPLGADPQGVVTLRISYPQDQVIHFTGEQYQGVGLWEVNPSVISTFERVRERLAGVPGVESVTGTTTRPFSGALFMTFRPEGREMPEGAQFSAGYMGVTPEYFETLRIPIVHGRGFTAQDRGSAAPVAIISETMAELYWPDEDPIGRMLTLNFVPDDPTREIVGVAGDVLLNRQQQQHAPVLYVPYAQQTPLWQGPSAQNQRGGKWFLVRTNGDPLGLLPSLRNAVAEIDPQRPVTGTQALEDFLGDQIANARVFALLLGVFAVIAGALASVGLYGVIAYTVAERSKEIGIRMALGAAGRRVLALVMRQAGAVIGLGLLLGLAGAVALTRLLSASLWGVTPTDPLTFATVSLLLVAVALLACVVPTRRALATDPAVSLRNSR